MPYRLNRNLFYFGKVKNEEKSRGRKHLLDSVKYYSDILYDIFDGQIGTDTQPAGALLGQNGLK